MTYCIVMSVYCYSQKSIPTGWRKETNAFGVTLYINTKTNEKVRSVQLFFVPSVVRVHACIPVSSYGTSMGKC